jgi:hypothetical protein
MRLVLIEWEDSHSDGSWTQLGGGVEDRALVCRSVGCLVLDGKRAKAEGDQLLVHQLFRACGDGVVAPGEKLAVIFSGGPRRPSA